MKRNASKAQYQINEFEALLAIRLKISSGTKLNMEEKSLWEEWLNRPHVREHEFVTEKTIDEMIQIHDRMLPWDKFLEKIEERKIKKIGTEDAPAKVEIVENTDINIRYIINWTYEKILLARKVLLVLIGICAVVYFLLKSSVDPYKQTVTKPRSIEEYSFSDGTHIWLNAGSTLTFPSDFSGEEKRYVELDGEALFIVKYNASYPPFRVITKSGEIETTTAQFNVDAHSDNKFQRSTLLTGTIIVKPIIDTGIAILKPGEQFVISGNTNLKIESLTRPKEVIAWHDNYFSFHQVTLGEIMKKLEKWYGVSIVVEEGIANKLCTIDGIPRNQRMDTVLDIMATRCGFRYTPERGFRYGDTLKILAPTMPIKTHAYDGDKQ